MHRKRIFALSLSAACHARVAPALCAPGQLAFPRPQLMHLDPIRQVSIGLRKLHVNSYIKLAQRMPLAWAYLYHSIDRRSPPSAADEIGRRIQRLNTRKLDDQLARGVAAQHCLGPAPMDDWLFGCVGLAFTK